ncbi:MAG: peptidylprolyl isomerase [Vicinamibacterales bacterium]
MLTRPPSLDCLARTLGRLFSCACLVAAVRCGTAQGNPKAPTGARSSDGGHAVIATDKGAIEIEFFQADAPRAVEDFRLLAEHGYHDGLTFHRVVRDFITPGGERLNGRISTPTGIATCR